MMRPRLERITYHISDPDSFQVVVMAQAHHRFPMGWCMRRRGIEIERLMWGKNKPYAPGHPLANEPDHRLRYSLKFHIAMQQNEPLSYEGHLELKKALDDISFGFFIL